MKRTQTNSIWNALKTAAICAAVFVCAPVFADEVTIRTDGDGLVLKGRIIGFDGTFLQIESQHGPLTLRYADVICDGADCPSAENYVPTLRLSGARRMAEVLMPALITGYGRARGIVAETETLDDTHMVIRLEDNAIFSLRLSNTDEGFADLIAHEADIVMATREATKPEVDRARAVGVGDLADSDLSRMIALDALVPVAHPGVTVGAVSLADLANIFAGEVTQWDAIGGTDAPVALHLGAQSDGQVQLLNRRLIAPKVNVTRGATPRDLADIIAQTPGAIGVLPYRETANTQILQVKDACGFTTRPSISTLKTEDYPLTAPLFLYLPARRQAPVVRDFLGWLRSPQAQLIVRRSGFVDQGAVPIPLDAQGQRFANAIRAAGPDMPLVELQRMVRVLTSRTRLSTSFRFEVGSTRLDAQSRSNLLTLGQAIKDGRYAGQSLMLVGFSDGRGSAEANRDLSSARSEAVKRSLVSALGEIPENVTIETEAFGEALPMACDDTEWGRQTNRRVELWTQDTAD